MRLPREEDFGGGDAGADGVGGAGGAGGGAWWLIGRGLSVTTRARSVKLVTH
ncbi:hypothetical protein ACLILY_04380 [Mycobacterium sp. MS3]|uniref:hypothetical protein n=1 Tax=Mycobacterium sp. MS3 TaxID=3391378 RepID=UPI003988E670